MVHYTPHHAVVRRERSTTKIHIAYDGSAKLNFKPSQNECLEVGPYLIPKLFDILQIPCYSAHCRYKKGLLNDWDSSG